ncbi:iron ABC transporter substrate-binding protein [Isoptericola halotolerans]|uniref:Iron(III) transport system substrate-binding protein n=1 Tax=Isoptericola halotolerans TaxID=300560 RepID=A0ABX2A2N5_9MICO|nr:extracellular solute-binding protein [Isoptericola halotolerans]NOV97122.1 iron(III) transport system substrate-binding protein [Isoptericola halotolerans]
MRLRRTLGAVTSAALVAALAACGTDEAADAADADAATAADAAGDGEALVIYSGRNEDLVGPLLDDLEAAVGVPVEVRYADSAELAAQLAEEGDRTPADVFFSQDAGALGALAKAGLLAELPDDVTAAVRDDLKDASGSWVATSARARVLVHDADAAPEVTGFDSVDDLLDPAYTGKIGYAPTNASWQSFVTALRVMRGEDGAEEWLTQFAALEPVDYEKNGAVLQAVNDGEVAVGLINHYYWYPLAAELGEESMNAQIHFLDADDPGALINVAGAGTLAASDQPDAAAAAVAYLLSEDAQQYFADETAELPVVEGVTSTVYDVGSLDEMTGARLDLNDLDSLPETQALLEKVGLL